MPNALARPGSQLVFAVAGALVFVGSLLFFVARYAWGMDGVPPGATMPAVLFNVVLFSVFALHHSVFARTGAKDWVRRTWPPALERSVYVWIASLLFIGVCGLWQPVPGRWWEVEGGGRTVMLLGQLAAVVFILASARRLDVLELAGIVQVLDVREERERIAPSLDTTGPYRPRPASHLSGLAALRLAGTDDEWDKRDVRHRELFLSLRRSAVRGEGLETNVRGRVRRVQ